MFKWVATALAFLIGVFLLVQAFTESPIFALPGVAMVGASVWYGVKRSLLTQGVFELTWGASILLNALLSESMSAGDNGSEDMGRYFGIAIAIVLVGHGVRTIAQARRQPVAERDSAAE